MTAKQRYAARGHMTAATVKELVRERDRDSCVECGMSAVVHLLQYGRQLEVHRIVPGSLYTVAGCVTLCSACHDGKPHRANGEPDLEIVNNTPPRQFRLSEETMAELQFIAEHHAAETGVPQSRADAVRIAARKEVDRIRKKKP